MFLPTTPQELAAPPDFVLITGDAYVDHPSFGVAIIGRLLESHGYSVAVLAQPDWKTTADFTQFGKPKLAFLVSGGNIDSMVNHYSVALHKRKTDAYSAGGAVGKRPNRATIVYGNKIREVYKDTPIILGGIEASLRRLAHYDYWDNAVRRSILLDSSADLLVYGMGERQIIAIAEALESGLSAEHITFIAGTVFKTKTVDFLEQPLFLPSFKAIKEPDKVSKMEYAKSVLIQHENVNLNSKILAEEYGNIFVVQNPPAEPLTTAELDRIYSLPYERNYHPKYEKDGGVPAIEEVKFSITSHRGCFGGCNFCALGYHQGKQIQARSDKSILAEAEQFTHDPDFKGYIHDVGGPTANFRANPCKKPCKRHCLAPKPCKNLEYNHQPYINLLRKLRKIPKVKKIFIRSGVRYDYVLNDPNGGGFLQELCEHHVSGRLKVAPEHVSENVLNAMGKPSFKQYTKFAKKFDETNEKLEKPQYLVPYLMSSHPGCDLADAVELAEYLKSTGHMPEQVQDFYPTPGTISTCMYYTGLNPYTLQKIYVPKGQKEKAMQRALMQYRLTENYELVKKALIKAGRTDLIGHDPKALIRPRKNNKKFNVRTENPKNQKSAKNGKKTEKPAKKPKTEHGKKTRKRG
ncbi:MAG: YgiQ family radical SAM protein [Defluviitaleaceae bacterium]|nr:YgiQ family radical SAM protein [Defluviitaleaceae bacterium]